MNVKDYGVSLQGILNYIGIENKDKINIVTIDACRDNPFEQNWNATHIYAGKFWLYGGILQMILGFVLPGIWTFISFFVIMIPMVFAPIIFSYRFFKAGK